MSAQGRDFSAERWLAVTGWEDAYEISDHGRVRSLPKSNRAWTVVLKPATGKNGYLYVALCRNATPRTRLVHHLVAEAFIGPRPPGLEIRHLDGNGKNNTPGNLTYGTSSENEFDKVRHGTHNHAGQTHCIRHHEFTPENTYINTVTGSRQCRECHQLHRQAYKERRRLVAA
jgi:hypothetical protein